MATGKNMKILFNKKRCFPNYNRSFSRIFFILFSTFIYFLTLILSTTNSTLLADTDQRNLLYNIPYLSADKIGQILILMSKNKSAEDYYLPPPTKNGPLKSNISNGSKILPSIKELIPEYIRNRIDRKKKQGLTTTVNIKKIAETGVEKNLVTDIPLEVDLRPFDTPIKSQFGGTCTTFGLIAAMENLINSRYNRDSPENRALVDLSERHLWNTYRSYDDVTAMSSALKNYITEENYWPQNKARPYANYLNHAHTKLLSSVYVEDNINKAILALARGNPIYIGLSTTKGMTSCAAVINPHSPLDNGGHALAVVGYHLDDQIIGGGYFIIKNSWGSDCADHGYQYLPFYHCQRKNMYCTMWELTDIDTDYGHPTSATLNPNDISGIFTYHKKWYQVNYRIQIKLSAPTREQKQISSVTYSIPNSSISPITMYDYRNSFEWSLQAKSLNFPVDIEIKLKDGQQLLKNLVVK